MDNQARPPARRRDEDGVEIAPIARGRRTFWLIGLAVALPIVATLAAVAIIRAAPSSRAGVSRVAATRDGDALARADGAAAAPAAAPRPAPIATAGAGPAPAVVPRRIAGPAPAAPDATPVPKPEKPEKPRREIDARDAIEMLRENGEHGGIAAFGLPGSDPPKSGIIVPEEYELPEGYVRHYQSTDDGEPLPAILMFHPDYEFVDAQGQVVPLPKDRVVPPEMAPLGLATGNRLQVPERKPGEPIR